MNKILTVSIAAYNVEKTLSKTLSSLVKANSVLDLLEIIIVNDGSTDCTLKIARDYESKYPKSVQVIDKINGGYGSTINESLTIATGKYYRLLDGDDTFVTENLEAYINFLSRNDEDMIICPYYEIDEKLSSCKLIDAHKRGISFKDISADIMMHEIAIKTVSLRKLGVKITEKCFYTDNEFVFYAIQASNGVRKFDLPIYNYYVGQAGQSISVEGVRRHYKDTIVVAKKLSDNFVTIYDSDISKNKQKLMENKIKTVIKNVYGSFLIIDSTGEYLGELKAFDVLLKKCFNIVYRLTSSVRKIQILRITNFVFYKYFCKRERRVLKIER